jgi:type I restriction enzyme, S subunit
VACEWRSAQLGDVTELITGFPFQSERYTDDPVAPRLLRGDNVVQGSLRWDGAKRWPRDATDGLDNYWLRDGDIVLAMDRPWIEAGLKYAAIRSSDLPALLVQRVACLRGTSELHTRFLKYVIGSQAFTDHVLTVQTGTAVPHISGGQIKSFHFSLPPLAEQRAIAHILGTLDDKIELNRRMNETLEVIARAIFKSWFVDATEDGLPKGWRNGTVSDLATISRDGLNPGEFPDEIFDHYSIPAFDEGRTPKPETGDVIKSNKFIIPHGCVMVSKLNPRIPRVWLPDVRGENRAVCSTEFLITTPKPGVSREYLFCFFSNEAFVSVFATMVTGTSGSHQRVKPESLLGMDAVIPPPPVMQSFTDATQPLLERINHNIAEARTLAALRDALLPKLLSDELRVPAAAKLLEVHA